MRELNPSQIELTTAASGLYESFYFRGTSQTGHHAFWLKHNLLRYRGSERVKLECALILFDRERNTVAAAHDEALLEGKQYEGLVQPGGWDDFRFRFPGNSQFSIAPAKLEGKLPGASWSLATHGSGETLFHYTPLSLYTSRFPKKKILTRDIRVRFEGELAIGELTMSGHFIGMNGHNWGTEHAQRYGYANCQQWDGGADAIFDAFSAKVRLLPGITSPYVTIAALKLDNTWHYFNKLSAAPWQRVSHLSDYRWSFAATNSTHRLEADIDGSDPHTRPWVALNYQHPSHAVSVVKNTKFATGRIRLIERATRHERLLTSNLVELETLLEKNKADPAEGYRSNNV